MERCERRDILFQLPDRLTSSQWNYSISVRVDMIVTSTAQYEDFAELITGCSEMTKISC